MSQEKVFFADENNPSALLQEFIQKFSFYSDSSKEKITKAWDFLLQNCKDKKRPCGSPYYLHPLRIAYILAQREFDDDCICAGLLHSIYDFEITSEEISSQFGTSVAKIIDGTSKIMHIPVNSKTLHQADAIRKMLFAMVDDVRVIFVKLADRLDRIRNIKTLESSQQKLLASEIIDIWAPLADRLGMSKEKNEFEDLSLKYTNPDAFQQIKAVIAQKKDERAAYLQKAVSTIQAEADKIGIQVSISSRAKHFYSIYQKMRKRNKEPSELFDLLALRVICQHKTDCYTLIGIVHGLWKPLEGRFKDYIAMPKANGYQSLHTTVMCEDKPLEIQIRTQKMHDIAEHGVASHWLYKKGMNHDLVDVNNLSIFNQLQELRNKPLSDETFFQNFKNDLLGDEVLVFTPKGEVKKLPLGSNAIDFAYSIHSAIGEKIVGAKANGKIIPLTQPLQNTQIIEILTNPQAHPTESQLKSVKTTKAKQKIHSWLVANDSTFEAKSNTAKIENEASKVIQEEHRKHKKGTGLPQEQKETGKVKVGNTTNFIVTFAKCCNPKYPDPISGYVSTGRGLIIHKANCITFHRIPNIQKRTLEVEWEVEKDK
ncbi:MAG: bifunctional (p)ppGpp synthetase/guanosine-3',5'-bis(diphosphate) 3'-pyrophosphohydrolase [Treponema sp.]|nr:bifunctional (p)ppGpp synthetase/guanosine-3',5'-bis(diphosphate) 3'-pyrophosphohydrolase [Treponema sp.]MBQ5848319.1 bifunctional (p)ppGpp synthetase/guanosine-3',5'-bis(diphosphate) 3'-pyrophosphohydrolase [Treponema sp.]